MSFKVLQKVFSPSDIRTHLDLEPHAGTVQAGQNAPVFILRNSAVCVYCPVLIYDAQRAPEPRGWALLTSHYKPQSHRHGFIWTGTGKLYSSTPSAKVHVNLSNFLQSLNNLKGILFRPSSHVLKTH